jgi:8-oxo-dGTP pyrophosphatase MutT (NUDIX family)
MNVPTNADSSAFAPDAFVFPGGAIDDDDFSPAASERTLGLEPARLHPEFRGLAAPRDAAALSIAALRELLEESGVLLAGPDGRADAGKLVLFSRWITPPNEPRRFDTYFFLARMPDDQTAVADAAETHDGRWIAPLDALAEFSRGALHLVYPTIKHLERLIAFDNLEALFAFARSKPVTTIAPYTSPQNGFKMPPDLEGTW